MEVETYVSKLKSKLEEIYQLARENLRSSAVRQKKDNDTRISQNQFCKGSLVYKFNNIFKKLNERWSGPFVLVDVLSPVLYKIKNRYKSETVHYDKLKKYQSDDVPAWAVAVQKGIKMSEIYNSNWADCLYEGKKRDTIWHIILNHVQEDQVPFYCNICHYRGNTRRTMERHIITYKPHLEKMEEFNIDSCNSCIIKSVNPYFVKLGTDASCDAIYKDQSCTVTEEVEEIIEIMEDSGEFNVIDNSCQTEETFICYRELKAEMNILKGSHQAELNRFGSYIARLEQRLKAKEDDVQSAERKLRKGEEGNKKQLQEKDDVIRKLERKLRHKDNEVEVLRRKLRVREYETDDEKENEMPRKKLKGYVVKKLF
ncbi:unnamed protein product [Mytilus coruscus]|uniref:Uncharacterized protein n=1 Tax=Mytilus coruscus TaxID=42192 RepID=A0A6J7ZUM0_MYTCO|nr:unnamed protein product [Mytilus coruscus]